MVRVVSWQSEEMWYRSRNRQYVRDRGAEMRLTERTRTWFHVKTRAQQLLRWATVWSQ